VTAWLLSPIGKYAMVALAILFAGAALVRCGQSIEQGKQAEATVDAYRDRDAVDQRVNQMTMEKLCLQLGGQWKDNKCV
jgi:hypothetical protein